jgi:hypothetical protein
MTVSGKSGIFSHRNDNFSGTPETNSIFLFRFFSISSKVVEMVADELMRREKFHRGKSLIYFEFDQGEKASLGK